MEKVPLMVKYSMIGSLHLQNLLGKISQHTTSNKNASKIHKIVKECQRIRTLIGEDYDQNIMQVFGQKDEAGKLLRPEGEPNSFIPLEGKEEELKAANEAFGEKEVEFKWQVFDQHILADMKMSASDIQVLGDLYKESEGPGAPLHIV